MKSTQYLLLSTQYVAVEYECDVGKAKCKAALQKELGFDVDPKIPLLGWIGRLDFQKGPDVVLQSVEPMAQKGCQVSSYIILAARCISIALPEPQRQRSSVVKPCR